MGIVDRHGLPIAVCTHAANHREVTLVQLTFDFYMIEAKPEKLIGDTAHDSDHLDDDLKEDGIDMIAPRKENRRKEESRMDESCVGMSAAGLLNGSLHGYHGIAESLFDGNTMPRIFSVLSSLPPFVSCLNNFEIGS